MGGKKQGMYNSRIHARKASVTECKYRGIGVKQDKRFEGL